MSRIEDNAEDLRRAARHAEPRVAAMFRRIAGEPTRRPRLGSHVPVHPRQLPLFPEGA